MAKGRRSDGRERVPLGRGADVSEAEKRNERRSRAGRGSVGKGLALCAGILPVLFPLGAGASLSGQWPARPELWRVTVGNEGQSPCRS